MQITLRGAFLLHNEVSYKCDGTHATYCIVYRPMSICYTGSNRLICALGFDSQLSCVFLLIKCIPIFLNVSLFPLLLIASSIFPALLDADTLNQ